MLFQKGSFDWSLFWFFSQFVGRKGSRDQGFKGPRVAESDKQTVTFQSYSILAFQHIAYLMFVLTLTTCNL